MAEARPHQAKQLALEAYRAKRLSTPGRVRLERHLADCAVCRETLDVMRRYQALLEAAQETTPPAIDWQRMELPLQREAARIAQRALMRKAFGLVTLAVAASVALFVARRDGRMPSVEGPMAAPQVAPSAATLHVEITAIVGEVVGVDASGKRVALDLASSPAEGWVLETGARSELHLALEQTAALLVPPESTLRLRSLREGQVVLDLSRGTVINHVRKLVGAEGYEVSAAGHRIAVRGTRFSVERMAPGLAVQVDEGVVAVLDDDGNLITELKAPYRWTEGLGGLASAPSAYADRLREPREPGVASTHWPALEVPSWPHVVNWQIDGSAFDTSTLLRMRVPAGDLDILATLDDGRRMSARMHVDALGAKFDPRLLRWLNPRPLSDAAVGAPKLSAGSAASVIHEDQGALQRCYERAMRGQTNLVSGALRVRLRMDLDAEGRVKRAALATQDEKAVPPLLDDCVRQVAQRWRFEAPGGRGVTFEAPLSFRPAQ
jgi:hypothetical protein